MRVMTIERQTYPIGRCLTSYLSEPKHPISLTLNEFPKIQWISDLPKLKSSSLIGTDEVEVTSTVRLLKPVYESSNSLYIGSFSADSLDLAYSYWDSGGTQYTSGSASFDFDTENQLSTYLKDSDDRNFIHKLVLLEDLANIGTAAPHTESSLPDQFEATFKSSKSISPYAKRSSSTLGFHVYSYEKAELQDDQATPQDMYILSGNFKPTWGGDNLNIYGSIFSTKIMVGDVLHLMSKNSVGDHLGIITKIEGDGTKDGSIKILIRDYEIDESQPSSESWSSSYAGDSGSASINFPCGSVLKGIRMGIFRMGYSEVYPNPQVGLRKSFKDYSVRKNLINGSYSFKNRNLSKVFSGEFVLTKDEAKQFLRFSQSVRAMPFPMEIITGVEDDDQASTFYGYFVNPAEYSFADQTGSLRNISFTFQEIY